MSAETFKLYDSIIAVVVILVLYCIYIMYRRYTTSYIISQIDGKSYNVKNYDDNVAAADALATINNNITILVKHLKKKYTKEHHLVKNILQRYDPDVINEHIPSYIDSQVAYTNNKGDSLYICLRKMYDSTHIHKINLLMFVALHELAHIATNVKQHPYEFWCVFKFILNESVIVRIYEPVDYAKHPETYCNDMVVNYSPYYDNNLDTYAYEVDMVSRKAI